MIAGREPLGARWRQGSTGHEIMDMRMIGHIPRPGVQDPNQAELSAEELAVHGQGFQSGSGGPEEQVIHEVLVRAGHRPQFLGQGSPCPLQGVFIEKLDVAQGNGTGTARVMRDVFEIEKVGTEFFLRNIVGGLVVMLRQLADGPDIHLLGPCGQASELQVFDHPLAQLSHGYTSCT